MSPDDSGVIAACQAGDLEQFGLLYERYVDRIYAFIHRRTFDRATAEDITSIVFMKALERIGSYASSKGTFSAWLHSIARNAVTDHFRSAGRIVTMPETWEIASADDVPGNVERAVDVAAVRSALVSLDPLKRDIVMMRLWDGLSYDEIASVTGKSAGNCKVIVSRSIDALRSQLSPAAFLLLFFPPFTS